MLIIYILLGIVLLPLAMGLFIPALLMLLGWISILTLGVLSIIGSIFRR